MGKSPKKAKKPRNDWESGSDDSGTSSLELEEARRKAAASARRSHTRSSGFCSEKKDSEEPMDIDEYDLNLGVGQSNPHPRLHEEVRARLLDKGKKDGFGRDAHVLGELASWLKATERQKTDINLIEVALMLRGANEIYKSQLQTTKKSFQELLNHCTAAGAEDNVAENEENLDMPHSQRKKPKKSDKRKNQVDETVNPVLETNGTTEEAVVPPPPTIEGVGDQAQDSLETPIDVQTDILVNPGPGPSGIFPDTNTTVIDVPSSSALQQQQEFSQIPHENVLPGPASDDAAATASIPDSGIGSGVLSLFGFSTPVRSQMFSQDSGFGDFTPSVNGTDPSSVLPDGLARNLATEFEVVAQEQEQENELIPVKRQRRRLVMPPRDPKESIRQCAVDVGELIRAQLEISRVRPKTSSKLPILRACFDTMSICSNSSSVSMPCLSIQGSPSPVHTIEDMTPWIPDPSTLIPIDDTPMDVTNIEKAGTSLVPGVNEFNVDGEMPSTSGYQVEVVAPSGTNLGPGILSEAKQTLFNNLSRNLQIMFHQLLFDNLPQYQRTAFLRDIQTDILKMKEAANLSLAAFSNSNGHHIVSCDDVLRSLVADAQLYVQNLSNVDRLVGSRTQRFAPMAQENPHQAIVHLIPKESAVDWRTPSPIQEKIVKRFSPRIPLEYTFRCEALLTEALRKIIVAANRASNTEIDIGLLQQRLAAVLSRSEQEFTVLRLLQSAGDASRSPRIATGCFFAMLQLLENKALKLEGVGITTTTIDASQLVRHDITDSSGVQTTGGAFAQRTHRM